MKIYILLVTMLLFFASPVFAAGELNITAESLAPAFANTNTSVTILNLTFNVTNNTGGSGIVNITAINVTINVTAGNISFAELRNASASFGSNFTVAIANSFLINISSGFEVNISANRSVLVVLNLSRFATSGINISINISTQGIFTNETSNNITFRAGNGIANSSVSHGVQIQDIHANVSISPRFVDTSVINQSFIYTIVPTGRDNISTVLIQVPGGLTFINITAITIDGSNSSGLNINTTIGNFINITTNGSANNGTINRMEVYFKANASSTAAASALFNTTLYGSNLSNITADPVDVVGSNITIQQILNITDVKIVKSTAIVNGTDFWEFNFTLNYTPSIAGNGIVQFKLTNWTSGSQNISLTNAPGATAVCAVTHCATLRNETSFSTLVKFNVTNDYESFTKGINVTSIAQNSTINLVLRMVIPSGTPISSAWQATYGFLFRITP